MASQFSTALLVVSALTILLASAEGHASHKVYACRKHEQMLAFKMLGGRPRVAILKYKLIDDHCEKVQSDPPSTDDLYVSHDCQRCQRQSGDKWTCERIKDEASGAADKPNCRSVLGPDCKPYLVDKHDSRRSCV